MVQWIRRAQQHLEHLTVRPESSHVQWTLLLHIFDIHLSVGCQQRAHHVQVALLTSLVQRHSAFVVAGIHINVALAQETFDYRRR
jgi:hypothetical protein